MTSSTNAGRQKGFIPVEPWRVRTTLRSMMNWLPADYERHRKAYPSAVWRESLETYSLICAEMRDEYVQWATNLLLHYDSSGKKSTLQAAYDPDTAPDIVQLRAEQRRRFLQMLYDALPQLERERYSWLLQPGYLNKGSMPDTQAAQVLYILHHRHVTDHIRFQKVAHHLAEQGLLQSPESGALPQHYVLDLVGQRTLATILEAKAPVDNSRPDSIFARLLLNTTINRLLTEQQEHARLMRQAAVSVHSLLVHLRPTCGKGLGVPLCDRDIERKIRALLVCDGHLEDASELERQVKLVLERVDAVSDPSSIMQGNLDALNYPLTYRFLAAMCVAWSFRRREVHDIRIAGSVHRTHQVIGGRASDHDGRPRPSIMTYHRMQVSLLWTTGQLREIAPEAIEVALAHRERANTWWSAHYAQALRNLTLADWEGLTRALGIEDLDVKAHVAKLDEQHTQFEKELATPRPRKGVLDGTGYPGFGAEMMHECREWLRADFGISDETFAKWDAKLNQASSSLNNL